MQPEALREAISSWQLMAFTVAKLRSGLRTGFIHGWSGVSSRHETNSTGVRPGAGRAMKNPVYPRPQQLKELNKQVKTMAMSDVKFGRKLEG